MGFFDRLRALFAGRPPTSAERYLPIYVWSNRCREPIAGRVDTLNELSGADADNAGEGDAPANATWFVRKGLATSGQHRCFDTVEVRLWLDAGKRVIHHQISGGRWLEADEYERLLAARAQEEAAAEEAAAQAAAEAENTNPPAPNPPTG